LVDCKLLLIVPFLFFFSFYKAHVLGFFNQSYDFSRKSLSKYLMDTIDFNKYDIDIFINLAKIVRYGRHWDESCNEWRLLLIIYFDCNFPYAKLRPYDVDWIFCPGEIKDYTIKTKILWSVDWLVTCNKIVIAVTN
jgi:hypothetical protein